MTGVDIPIGLPSEGLRAADVEARVFVGAEHDQAKRALTRDRRAVATTQNLTNLPATTSDGRLVGLLTQRDAEKALTVVKKS